MNIFEAIFGTKHARDVKRLRPIVNKINEWDEKYKALSDEELLSRNAAKLAAQLSSILC